MRLLFDHNLSPRLVELLSDVFPGSTHTSLEGLERADDADIWDLAAGHGYTIVTKDADFQDMATLRGGLPKVVWLRLGNCTTSDIERVLRDNESAVIDLDASDSTHVLVLSWASPRPDTR